jgi:FtsZ-binding cell division protein ZapB
MRRPGENDIMANPTTVSNYAPFYASTLPFRSLKAEAKNPKAYDCLVCGSDIGPALTPNLAISYTMNRYGTWAHVACLKNAKQPISTDQNAKIAARTAVQAQSKAKTTTTVSNTPHKTTVKTHTAPPTPPANMALTYSAPTTVGSLDALAADLRATIEAEYERLMQQALATIQDLQARVATLESDNEKLAMELSRIIVTSVSDDQRTKNARMNDSALTPQEKGRCGAQKKDGTACRWDTSKTACMHHNKAA